MTVQDFLGWVRSTALSLKKTERRIPEKTENFLLVRELYLEQTTIFKALKSLKALQSLPEHYAYSWRAELVKN